MSAFLNKYNYDNVTERNIIIGIIDLLHNNISYINVFDNCDEQVIDIPFYYSFTGSDRFLYDSFLEKEICKDGVIEGNYDKVPRGILTYTGFNIESSSKTNPYVIGKKTEIIRDDNCNPKEMKTVYSQMRSIPILMNFDCKILVNSNLELFKISESLVKLFYKNSSFSVDINGVRVPGLLVMPESVSQEKAFEFSYNEVKLMEITFSFEVNTFILDFYGDKYEKRMKNGIVNNIYDNIDNKNDNILDING